MAEPAVVVQKAYDWTLWIIPKVEKFPRSHWFTVGQNVVTASMNLLLHLVDASYQQKPAESLTLAVREVNRIRYLMRLAKDLKMVSLAGHEFSSKAIDEVGRMTGGWLKASKVSREAGR